MKSILPFLFLLVATTGCKKAIEKVKEDAVLNAMTDGQWVVTSMTIDGVNHTADFGPYKFQYYKDRTVDAFNNGTLELKGNWDGDADAMTTWANFPSAPTPLSWLNGTWHIDDSSWTYVVASLTIGGEVRTLRLQKL